MTELKINGEDKEVLLTSLKEYLKKNLDFTIEQFDADFLFDFILEKFGPPIYNKGIDDAILTHSKYSEVIQEQIDLKRII